MTEEKSNLEKMREQNDARKAEQAAEEERRKKDFSLAKSELEQVQQNDNLVKMYRENARVGAENLGGNAPLLSVYKQGKSSAKLADGTDPIDGAFFYKPTADSWLTLDIHILTISRGFRTPALEDGKPPVFTQILSGVIIDGTKPFMMYVRGKRLNPMWEYAKDLDKYTHAKPFPIPMFALTTHLSTHEEPGAKAAYGDNWVIDFELVRNADKTPKLVLDEGEFVFLRDHVAETQEAVERMISRYEKGKPVDDSEEPPIPGEPM